MSTVTEFDAASGTTHSISPTDVSQFIRLEQCQRYLRLRLHERAHGNGFLTRADVRPQSIPPILTRSGATFETAVEEAIAEHAPFTRFSAAGRSAMGITHDNASVIDHITSLPPAQVMVLLQPRLQASIGPWNLRGDVDLLRLERLEDGTLGILIADIKSSTAAKVEHRLQVAFYRQMLESIMHAHGLTPCPIDLGILYRGAEVARDTLPESEQLALSQQKARASDLLGVSNAQLECIDDADAYLDAVRTLVTGDQSTAQRLLNTPFADIPFHLAIKCDGCLYNEFCLKDAARNDDLSLLPHMTDGDKSALKRHGVDTIASLATLKDLQHKGSVTIDGEPSPNIILTPAPARASAAKALATTWPVGKRLDELVHRARRYRDFQGDAIETISWIPGKGYGSLPASDATLHPNLVRVYIDVQHDYLENRLYLVGALVVGCEHGIERPDRRRTVVKRCAAPPETDQAEATLLREWIQETLAAISDVAAPDANGEPRAPLHLIFTNGFAQRLLLDACGRHATTILGATAIYDFVTQIAGYESPISSLLEDQIREHKNYPMLCQSLQSVATFLGFAWNDTFPFRQLFRERMFDYVGKLTTDDGEPSQWYTSRSRFNSQIPLEYAYAAWDALPPPTMPDAFVGYRQVTPAILEAFHQRRLEAMEHIVHDFKGNRQTTITPFDLIDLAAFEERAPTLAHALDEFVTIERHVELASWKGDRHASPDQRFLRGQSLTVCYLEEDQTPEMAEANRENLRRFALRQEQEATYWKQRPNAKRVSLSREDQALSKWSDEGNTYRLRIDIPEDSADLEALIRSSTLKTGARLIITPRQTTDSRLPIADQVLFTPTAKQILNGPGLELDRLTFERENDQVVGAIAEVTMTGGRRGNASMGGFAFGGQSRPLKPGERYTLDEDPNNFNAYWASKVTSGIVNGGQNRLYTLLDTGDWSELPVPAAAIDGQARFLSGLDALREAGALHDFEASKRSFIGDHAAAPLLLVQGPPGTGKSYSTAFALFARLQGAMAANQDFRIIISCKTHAAIDVLLHNVRDVQNTLRQLATTHREVFDGWFDHRLLGLPLFRLRPRGTVQPGIIALPKDGEREKGTPKAVDRILAERWSVIAGTPGGVYGLIKDHWDAKNLFAHEIAHCLVLDEASQMNIPEALMAALPLAMNGQTIVVGDHRQMPPIVKNDWSSEPRRTFHAFRSYESLFVALLALKPPLIQFEESFRLHKDMAEFLRREIYAQDKINYHSSISKLMSPVDTGDSFIAAVLKPTHPLVVVVHDEASSQLANPFERELMAPIIAVLSDPDGLDLSVDEGMGVVVPHRAQRADFIDHVRAISRRTEDGSDVLVSAVDTVERFQGDERTVMLIGATESDRDYLLVSGKFLLDPRRLTVALSRAKRKMILVAARSVFEVFSTDEETFANAQLWKNLLRKTCTELLWEGDRHGVGVQVWGNPSSATETDSPPPAAP